CRSSGKNTPITHSRVSFGYKTARLREVRTARSPTDSPLERTGSQPLIPVPKRPGLSGGTGSAAEANRAHSKASSTRGGDRGFESRSLQQRVYCEPAAFFLSGK